MKKFAGFLAGAALILTVTGCGTSDGNDGDSGIDATDDNGTQLQDADGDADDVASRDLTGTDEAAADSDAGDESQADTTADAADDARDDSAEADAAYDADTADATDDTVVPPTNPWHHMPVTIDDEVVNGEYLMTAVDGLTFGYNPTTREWVTLFDRDQDEPSATFLWHLDEFTGKVTKKTLTGTPFADGTNFCNGENWCQFMGFNQADKTWVVLGPRTPGIMKVNEAWEATVTPLAAGDTDPDQPPNGAISYSHIFTGDAFYVYGWITSSDFSRTLLKFDLATNDWTVVFSDLPALFTNCLAFDSKNRVLYSVGGLTTTDGGNTSSAYGKAQKFQFKTSEVTTFDLPPELATREGLSCAIDGVTGRLFVSGGSVMVDNLDERQNTYHNDLWLWDGTQWKQIVAEGPVGEFEDFGDVWALEADASFPNFGRNIGKMVYDASEPPRLILMGDVPGSATQVYTLDIQNVIF